MHDGQLILIAGALLAAGLLASLLAGRVRVPSLLLFLGIGMLIGSDGLGWIAFNDYELARTIGIVALALILFEGGLTSGLFEIRPVTTAVATVPSTASEIAVGSTGRISNRPDVRPPSNRIRASATIPIVRASS